MNYRRTSCSRGHPFPEFRRIGNSGAYCAACKYARDSVKPRDKAKYHIIYKNSSLKALYGIDHDQYLKMLKEQKGLCAICGYPPHKKKLHVDHDHKTKMVRKLLCHGCNTGIGSLMDDKRLLKRALDYLIEHTSPVKFTPIPEPFGRSAW